MTQDGRDGGSSSRGVLDLTQDGPDIITQDGRDPASRHPASSRGVLDLTQDDVASEEPFDEAIRDQDVLYGTASERRGNTLKGFKGF